MMNRNRRPAHTAPRLNITGEAALFLLILGAALALRCYEIGYGFDGDEVFSVNLAARSFSKTLEGALQDTPHPPLYYTLLHGWIKAFGSSEAAVRSLSVLFSGLALGVMYGFFRRLLGFQTALTVLALLSLSPLFVYYGQQARPYALIIFLSACNLYAFVRVLERPRSRPRALLWAGSCAILMYAQYLAVLSILLQVGLAFFHGAPHRARLVRYGLAGSLAVLPWALLAMGRALFSGTDPIPHTAWIEVPSISGLIWLYVSIFGECRGVPARWLILALCLLLLAYGTKRITRRTLPAEEALVCLTGFGLPLAVFGLSVLGPKPVFAERQLLGAAVASAAVFGLGLKSMPKRAGALIAAGMLLWTALSIPQGLPHNRKPPWREIAAQIDTTHGAQEVMVQENWVREPLEFYRRSGPVRVLGTGEGKARSGFIYACRPAGSRCSLVETGSLVQRRTFLENWQWGSPNSRDRQLFLYRIERITPVEEASE